MTLTCKHPYEVHTKKTQIRVLWAATCLTAEYLSGGQDRLHKKN